MQLSIQFQNYINTKFPVVEKMVQLESSMIYVLVYWYDPEKIENHCFCIDNHQGW